MPIPSWITIFSESFRPRRRTTFFYPDRANAYQLINNGEAVTSKNRKDNNYDGKSSKNRDIIVAKKTEDGFAVLLEGTSNQPNRRYKILYTNDEEIITSRTNWSPKTLLDDGKSENNFLDYTNLAAQSNTFNIASTDIDLDGIVDGSESTAYQIYQDGLAITLRNRKGKTFRDQTARNWDVTQISQASSGEGFAVLREGANKKAGLFRVWFTNSSGIITSGTTWKSGEQLANEGLEDLFKRDFNGDKYIGETPIDDYGITPETSGTITANSSVQGDLEQPDDHDLFSINLTAGKTYQFSATGITLSDPYLTLYNPDGSFGRMNDDHNTLTRDSKIVDFEATQSGLHYLDVNSYQEQSAGTYILSALESFPAPSGFSLEDGYGQINALAAFNKQFNIDLPTVRLPGNDQWALNNINIPAVWKPSGSFLGATGSGTTVAVIDTGIDYSHDELSDKIVTGWDFVDNDNIAEDLNNHGTHVAAIIAGKNDGVGITGAAYDANIMPIKVLNADGIGYTSDIIAGINFAANKKVDVINLSLGGGINSQAMQDAIANASNLGVTVVMAAGNNGGPTPISPAINAANYGLAVGAVNQSGSLTDFSNRSGSSINYVTAPGEGIKSAIAGNSYATYSGTSMATPFVAGLAALLIDYDESLLPDQIVRLLTSTATNSNSSSTSQNANNYDGLTNTRSLITLETINDFTNDDLTNPLIGIFGGDAASRKQNASKISSQQGSALGDFDYFEVLDPLSNNFASLAFNSDTESDRLSTLNELLSNNYFESFEIDQKWSIA